VLEGAECAESRFDERTVTEPVTEETARAVAMVVFGFTGVILMWQPRSRRLLRAVSGRG
jgi:hypothetical protein